MRDNQNWGELFALEWYSEKVVSYYIR